MSDAETKSSVVPTTDEVIETIQNCSEAAYESARSGSVLVNEPVLATLGRFMEGVEGIDPVRLEPHIEARLTRFDTGANKMVSAIVHDVALRILAQRGLDSVYSLVAGGQEVPLRVQAQEHMVDGGEATLVTLNDVRKAYEALRSVATVSWRSIADAELVDDEDEPKRNVALSVDAARATWLAMKRDVLAFRTSVQLAVGYGDLVSRLTQALIGGYRNFVCSTSSEGDNNCISGSEIAKHLGIQLGIQSIDVGESQYKFREAGPNTLAELGIITALAVLKVEQDTEGLRDVTELAGAWIDRYLSDTVANIAEAKWPEEGGEPVEPSQLVEDVAKSAGRVAQLMAAGYRMAQIGESLNTAFEINITDGLPGLWNEEGQGLWRHTAMATLLGGGEDFRYEVLRTPEEIEALYVGFIAASMRALMDELKKNASEHLSDITYSRLATIMAMKDVAPGVDPEGLFNKLNENGFFEELVGGGDGTELSEEQKMDRDLAKHLVQALLKNDPNIFSEIVDHRQTIKDKLEIMYRLTFSYRENLFTLVIEEQKKDILERLPDEFDWDVWSAVLPSMHIHAISGVESRASLLHAFNVFGDRVRMYGSAKQGLDVSGVLEILGDDPDAASAIRRGVIALHLLGEDAVKESIPMLYRNGLTREDVVAAANMAVLAKASLGDDVDALQDRIEKFIRVASRESVFGGDNKHIVLTRPGNMSGLPVYYIEGRWNPDLVEEVVSLLWGWE